LSTDKPFRSDGNDDGIKLTAGDVTS